MTTHDSGAVTPAEQYAFDCTGFFHRRAAVPAALLNTAQSDMHQTYADEVLPQKFPIMPRWRVAYELMTLPLIRSLGKICCGPHFRVDHAFGVGGDNPQLHGGPDSSQYSCFFHRVGDRNMLLGQLSIGVVIRPQSAATGGVCYVPGSHKAYDRRRAGLEVLTELFGGDLRHPAIVCPTLEPGDIVAFSESLVHGDTGQRQPGPSRCTWYYKLTPGWMCWRDPAQQAPAQAAAQTDLERRMLASPWTGRTVETATTRAHVNERRGETDV